MAYDTRIHLFANNAAGTLRIPVNNTQVTLLLQVDEGAAFPSPASGEIFKLTVYNPVTGAREVMHCTSRDGDSLTVERGQEDTTAQAFTAGCRAELKLTAETLHYLQALLT